eukprot:scaffold98008_cov20-Tisochrysis_lutea.AAC.1
MSNPSSNLSGKTALVTGATSGIGLETAKSLAREFSCTLTRNCEFMANPMLFPHASLLHFLLYFELNCLAAVTQIHNSDCLPLHTPPKCSPGCHCDPRGAQPGCCSPVCREHPVRLVIYPPFHDVHIASTLFQEGVSFRPICGTQAATGSHVSRFSAQVCRGGACGGEVLNGAL